MKMNFKELFSSLHAKNEEEFLKNIPKSVEKMYTESPSIDYLYKSSYEDSRSNKTRLDFVLKDDEKLGIFNYGELSLDMYLDDNDYKKEINLIYNNEKIVCYICFMPYNSGIQLNSSWNDKEFKGLFTMLLFQYILKHYDFVESFNRHSTKAIPFWIKLNKYAIENNHRFSIINKEENTEMFIEDPNFLSNQKKVFWNASDGDDYRF